MNSNREELTVKNIEDEIIWSFNASLELDLDYYFDALSVRGQFICLLPGYEQHPSDQKPASEIEQEQRQPSARQWVICNSLNIVKLVLVTLGHVAVHLPIPRKRKAVKLSAA